MARTSGSRQRMADETCAVCLNFEFISSILLYHLDQLEFVADRFQEITAKCSQLITFCTFHIHRRLLRLNHRQERARTDRNLIFDFNIPPPSKENPGIGAPGFLFT